MNAKYSITYKAEAPGGYGGTHWFFTRLEMQSFLDRAMHRGIGLEWIAS